jgi:hypothetical protein
MIHPHFIVTDCLDHQVHFSHRGMTGSTLITNFPAAAIQASASRRRASLAMPALIASITL